MSSSTPQHLELTSKLAGSAGPVEIADPRTLKGRNKQKDVSSTPSSCLSTLTALVLPQLRSEKAQMLQTGRERLKRYFQPPGGTMGRNRLLSPPAMVSHAMGEEMIEQDPWARP